MTRVACLYVDPRGPYPALVGSDMCWDEKRDARTYAGPWPVVAHPPCQRWCMMAPLNERYGHKVGDDAGCFAHALSIVRKFGGVLEHPSGTLAWRHFGLPRPLFGAWTSTLDGDWVCEVHQSAWGHPAKKKTWLLARCPANQTSWASPPATARISNLRHSLKMRAMPLLKGYEASRTPPAFAAWLVELASQVTPRQQSTIEET